MHKSDFNKWFELFKKLSDERERDKKENIRIMSEFEPDNILEIPEHSLNNVKLGFWSSPNGVIMIEANAKGEFDPRKAKFFSKEIINSLVAASEKQPNAILLPLEIE